LSLLRFRTDTICSSKEERTQKGYSQHFNMVSSYKSCGKPQQGQLVCGPATVWSSYYNLLCLPKLIFRSISTVHD